MTDMTADIGRDLKKLFKKYSEEAVVARLLNVPINLPSIRPDHGIMRFDDDTQRGAISVAMSVDADMWLELISLKDKNEPHAPHRFRVPFFGGGQSPRVRNAILFLALAMLLDNEKQPQHRPAE